MKRLHDIYRPKEERKSDWNEVERALLDEELKEQTVLCMNCGQPFCHAYGCPLGNLVPDQNRAVSQGDWKRACPLKFHAVPDTKETIKADLVFLAMGVPADTPLVAQLGLKQTPRTALVSDAERNIFCVGDCASGASLVVRALASGKNLQLY